MPAAFRVFAADDYIAVFIDYRRFELRDRQQHQFHRPEQLLYPLGGEGLWIFLFLRRAQNGRRYQHCRDDE